MKKTKINKSPANRESRIQKQSNISRRDILKGFASMGVISFSQLDKLLAATYTPAPMRVLFIFSQHGNGVKRNLTNKIAETNDFTGFRNEYASLNRLGTKSTIISGMKTLGQWGNNHDLSYGDVLTVSVRIDHPGGGTFNGVHADADGPSIDYLIEKKYGQTKPTYRMSAGYGSFGSPYHALCWDDNKGYLPFQTSASAAHEAYLSNIPAPGVSPTPEQNSATNFNLRTLASLEKSAQANIANINAFDKQKLVKYLSEVSALKSKKQPLVSIGNGLALPPKPEYSREGKFNFDEYLKIMKVGFANNYTNTGVICTGDTLFQGEIPDFHHTHAHEESDTFYLTRKYILDKIVSFAESLDKIEDTDGKTVLDNTLIVWDGEVGSGDHDLHKCPILIGGASGKRKMDKCIVLPSLAKSTGFHKRENMDGTLVEQHRWSPKSELIPVFTNADLLRDIGNMMGLNLSQFGLKSQNSGETILKS